MSLSGGLETGGPTPHRQGRISTEIGPDPGSRFALTLAGLFVLSLLLRAWQLARWSLWLDELDSLTMAAMSWSDLLQTLPVEVNMSLYLEDSEGGRS